MIIHYHFLPAHNVAVKRLVRYAERLPHFGWLPEILTRDWTAGIIDQDPSWGLSWEPEIERGVEFPIHRVEPPPVPRRTATAQDSPWPLRKAAAAAQLWPSRYPDDFVGWIRPAANRAKTLAFHRGIDAVVSYCPPETNHLVGRRVAQMLGVPWIPFFGDLWGFFIAQFPSTFGGLIRRAYHRWWMRPAAACAAVSPYMAEYLSRTYRKPSRLVLTGFAPDEFGARRQNRKRKRLVVSHVGSLYPRDQKPSIFFDGVDELLRRNPRAATQLDIRFIGSKCDDYLHDLTRTRRCASVCTIRPKVNSTVAVELIKDSDGLLAFNCTVHRAQHGTMSHPTKIFEAFGAQRPVLAIPADGDWVDRLLAQTGAGTTASNPIEVADTLSDWLTAWQLNGEIPFSGNPAELSAFTVDRQVAELADLLTSVSLHPH